MACGLPGTLATRLHLQQAELRRLAEPLAFPLGSWQTRSSQQRGRCAPECSRQVL